MTPKTAEPGLRGLVGTDHNLLSFPVNAHTSHWCPSSSLPSPELHPNNTREASKSASPSPRGQQVSFPFQSSYWAQSTGKSFKDSRSHPFSATCCAQFPQCPQKKAKAAHAPAKWVSQCHWCMWLLSWAEVVSCHSAQRGNLGWQDTVHHV